MTVFKKSFLSLGVAATGFSAVLVIFSMVFMNYLYYEINTVTLKNTAKTLFTAIGKVHSFEIFYSYQILDSFSESETFVDDIDTSEFKKYHQLNFDLRKVFFSQIVNDTSEYRLTLIAPSGDVLWDSHVTDLVNHLNREEIIGALEGNETSARRNSISRGNKELYHAIPVFDPNGKPIGVFRLSVSIPSFGVRISPVILPFIIYSCLLAIVVFWAIFAYSRSLADSVGRLVTIAQSSTPLLSGPEADELIAPEFRSLEKAMRAMITELNMRIEQAKALERIRKDFVANVSHELRTPIQLIKGFSETLFDAVNDNGDKKQILHFIDIIQKNAINMENLTNDLLILADLENDDANFQKNIREPELLPITLLIKEAVTSVELQAKKKNIEIITECPKKLIAKLYGSLIVQALINLIDNAIKYSPENSKIWVTAKEENGELVFEVRDNGIGIPVNDQERIFERFYRVDKARSKEAGGTGLGLSIVRHIALLHKGKAEVESSHAKASGHGEGSVFRICIPL